MGAGRPQVRPTEAVKLRRPTRKTGMRTKRMKSLEEFQPLDEKDKNLLVNDHLAGASIIAYN